MMTQYEHKKRLAHESRQRSYQKHIQKQKKQIVTSEWWLNKTIKEQAEQKFWCTSHEGCYRCSTNNGESLNHAKAKFEIWLQHKMQGHLVYTELRLKNGARPDLVVAEPRTGNIYCVEIVRTEPAKSLASKQSTYPFPIRKVVV